MNHSAVEPPLITGILLSTVVPASMTAGETTHYLTNLDLAFKLHYITTVHLFTADAASDLTVADLKKPMFQWLKVYNQICGRIRRHDGGSRPLIKCNDSGVRIVEAKSSKTVTEWLNKVEGAVDNHRLLVYSQPFVGDNFEFTPIVILQLTKFKCGGLSVGMSWAHILGDGFTATECINMWGRIMASEVMKPPLTISQPIDPLAPPSSATACLSVKSVEPVGDNWLTASRSNKFELQTHTFHFTDLQLSFELISAVIWKALAETGKRTSEIITVVKRGKSGRGLIGNLGLEIGVVKVEDMNDIINSDASKIAEMISEKFINETGVIEGEDRSGGDFLVYGGNLTFVDWSKVNLYGLEINGHSPVFADVSIDGVGCEGAVVVFPAPENGMNVNVILPEDEMRLLKNKLSLEFSVF